MGSDVKPPHEATAPPAGLAPRSWRCSLSQEHRPSAHPPPGPGPRDTSRHCVHPPTPQRASVRRGCWVCTVGPRPAGVGCRLSKEPRESGWDRDPARPQPSSPSPGPGSRPSHQPGPWGPSYFVTFCLQDISPLRCCELQSLHLPLISSHWHASSSTQESSPLCSQTSLGLGYCLAQQILRRYWWMKA